MVMKNKLKAFLETRNLTVYQFRKLTGIANKTAYDLVNRPEQYPSREVMDKICAAFEVQPNEIIEWVKNND